MSKIRVVHYINQFFAGVGGEEKAHIAPELRTELPPISVQLQGKLGEEFEV
ncbi:MAG: glycine/sarcosine/betaine reductase selenoprotein B family protein, partial [Gemella haemolysans]|nr:glycine/sarcosine/betaine reductase selenoprotein B family protein [Gemella haemolysans]